MEINDECESFHEIMNDICIYDSFEQHFKVKPQFRNYHDVLMFYKNTKRYGEFYAAIHERAEKEPVFDCISGNIVDLQEQIYNGNNQNIAFNQCISLDILEIENLPEILSFWMKDLDITNPVHYSLLKHFIRLCYILLRRSSGNGFDILVKDTGLVTLIKGLEDDNEFKNCIFKLLNLINLKRNAMNMPQMFPQAQNPVPQ